MSDNKEIRDAATRLAIAQAREDFLAFVMLMNPSFSIGPHHRVLCDELMKLEKKCNRSFDGFYFSSFI